MQTLERIRQKIGAARKALASAGDSVESIRAAIGELETERAAIANAPVPLAEATHAVTATIARLTASAGYTPASVVLDAAERGEPAALDVHAMRPNEIVGFLAGCLRPVLRQALTEQLEEHYRDLQPGLPADERAQRLADLDRQLLDLNREEERLIVELAELGIAIDRRPDASPAAVLGLNH